MRAVVARIPRRTFATFDALLRPDGASAPSLALSLRSTLALIFTITGALALTAASAFAASPPPALIGSFGASNGQFSGPNAVAVDQSNGDVYILDEENSRVEKFDPEGNPIASFGDSTPPNGELRGVGTPAGSFSFNFNAVAVDNSGGPNAGDLYVSDRGHEVIDVFDSSGKYLRQITGIEALGIAVDASGNLWTAGLFSRQITEFNPSGTQVFSFETAEFNFGLALDSTDHVYADQSFCGCEITKYNSDGSAATRIDGSSAFGAAPLAVDESNDNVYVADDTQVFEYGKEGNSLATFGSGDVTAVDGIAIDYAGPPANRGYIYVAAPESHEVKIFAPVVAPTATTGSASNPQRTSAELSGAVNPNGEPLTDCHFEYVSASEYNQSALNPYSDGGSIPCSRSLSSIGSGTGEVTVSAEPNNLRPQTIYHFRLVAGNSNGLNGREVPSYGDDETTTTIPAVASIKTEEASEVKVTAATLTGSFNPQELDTHYYFQYGNDTTYGQNSAEPPGADAGSGTGIQDVSMEVRELAPNTTYHYRIVATNSTGTTYGEDETFTTFQPPSVDASFTSNLSATTAVLHAKINPNGVQTTCHFEYGTTPTYGNSAPCAPNEDVGSSTTDQSVEAKLVNLEAGAIYHFRVIATSSYGTTSSADQTFNFLPPNCPNAHVRQQTGSEFLPDCRAYELVSPENAGNVIFFPASSPFAPYATNPARFAFGGGLGGVEGTEPTNSIGIDTYVATRTDSGWVTHYIGIPGSQTLGTNDVVGDKGFDKFIDFKSNEGFGGVAQPISKAPYVWDFNDKFLERWPADVTAIPNGDSTAGAFQPSPDFSHLAFSSVNVEFAPGGLTTEGGSAYDYDTNSKSIQLISKAEDGSDLVAGEGRFIEFPPINSTYGFPVPQGPDGYPGVSTNGSRILMSTGAQCEQFYGCPQGPAKLYMRVNDAVTYDVSRGHEVTYVGMTEDGSKVFFTSEEQLTPEDHDTSTDLYMWSESTNSLKLISIGNNGAGNTDSCSASWTAMCDVIPVIGAIKTDNAIAAESGDIYFYSPEQLDGSKGLANQENLYVYRNDEVQFVASLTPGAACAHAAEEETCGNGPLSRIQVSPDGDHIAFVTASHLTSYDNGGFQEMYTYEPTTEKIQCVSCIPNGDPPTGEVTASLDGLFMANDGRAFFYTPDALVPQDTNHLHDVYEFVEGRPQLITSGTGSEDTQTTPNQVRAAGLEGVSADGVNVYFSTYETLVPQDHNGQFMKFYDARTDGGFPYVPPAPPCEAADECHGAGSSPPAEPTIVSEGKLGGGGNAHSGAKKKRSHPKARKSARGRKDHHRRHLTRKRG